MVDSGWRLLRSCKLDQSDPLGSTDLAGVVAGGADWRRRQTTRSSRDAKTAEPRAFPHAPDPCLIATKICGGLLVDQEKDFNGSDRSFNGRMELGHRSGRDFTSGKKMAPPAVGTTATARTSQVRSTWCQEHDGWVLGPFKMKGFQASLPRRRTRKKATPTAAPGGARHRVPSCSTPSSQRSPQLLFGSFIFFLMPLTPTRPGSSVFLFFLAFSGEGKTAAVSWRR